MQALFARAINHTEITRGDDAKSGMQVACLRLPCEIDSPRVMAEFPNTPFN